MAKNKYEWLMKLYTILFCIKYDHFEFLMMTFDISNTWVTFIGLMKSIFCSYLDKFIIVFLYDILIYSKTLNDYRFHLQEKFQILR